MPFFYVQTHQVISDAGKSDKEKRRQLQDIYKRTTNLLDQFDSEFIKSLQKGWGDFQSTLKETIKHLEPREQYIVLVAGTTINTPIFDTEFNIFLDNHKFVGSPPKNSFLVSCNSVS